ncbi:RecQ family ATP-dependent DNA helicase [Leptobacterium flavescens]|uniref:ATP-dependent DNA helicase RecQ n=1 Tax=Leptobacterium flavescens TaxID=472055 RepID=A0A6P0UFA2_9FLAO|nr:ATP-dependent DNA helicase RecQ [Leptobacterium flavescens]NER11925.1 RecQ family ATP-dependent DNA helicase [Leptobacterium flavescens]
MSTPLDILKKVWGFSSFRDPQEEIVNTLMEGRDTLALLPTGGGKSICFQVPALAKEGICIVVSPLIALMRDQVENLKKKGIKAIALSSGLKFEEIDALLDNCIYGNYKFLYLSPERLQQELVLDRIRQMPLNLIAVDEAHCISQWGNDFRPAYRNCNILRELFPHVPIAALTASATPRVAEDIMLNLKLESPSLIKKSFARPNISYRVWEVEDKFYRIKQILSKYKGSSIVYVRNRRAAADVAAYLNANSVSASYYHGGISTEEKNKRLELWLQNKVQVMVATNAFGMGIDKADVRTVIHIQLPENLENYYQEAGRAGRDGEIAYAVILKNKGDEDRLKKQFLSVLPDTPFIKLLYNKLNNFFQISYGEGAFEKHMLRFNEFCGIYKMNPVLAYNGLKLLDRHSIIQLSQNFEKKTTVKFIVTNHQLFAYLDRNADLQNITQAILRTYGGIFDNETKINTHLIATKTGSKQADVEAVLERLFTDEIIDYQASDTDTEISFLVPREDDKTINIIAADIEQQRRLKEDHIAAVLKYAENNTKCRSVQLLEYFGESNTVACGICSVCTETKEKLTPEIIEVVRADILKLLKKGACTSREIVEKLSFKEHIIIYVLRLLLEFNSIEVNSRNEYLIVKSQKDA